MRYENGHLYMIITNYDLMSQQEKDGKSVPKKRFVTFDDNQNVNTTETIASSSASSSSAAPMRVDVAMTTQGIQTDDVDWSKLMQDKMKKKGKGVGRLPGNSRE